MLIWQVERLENVRERCVPAGDASNGRLQMQKSLLLDHSSQFSSKSVGQGRFMGNQNTARFLCRLKKERRLIWISPQVDKQVEPTSTTVFLSQGRMETKSITSQLVPYCFCAISATSIRTCTCVPQPISVTSLPDLRMSAWPIGHSKYSLGTSSTDAR